MVTVTATSSFVHDRIDAKRGDKIDIPESTAKELELRGLVTGKSVAATTNASVVKIQPTRQRQRNAPAPANKKAPDPENKQAAQSTNTPAPAQSSAGEDGNAPQV